ncbi:MAG: EscU/YscU/HrcU family type III secretion system export apparatus switch protein [Terriglobales bacterium]|jgi:flagellar biosynthetic protein FlhB
MPESNQTEQATPRRREKAREKGQVARSRDLIGAASGMAAVFVLFSMMASFPLAWRGFFHDCLEGAISGNLRMDAPTPFLTHSGLFIATIAALGLGWTVALASALAQGGLVFAPTSLLPTASRISPAAKLKQLLSITALRGLIKSLLPAIAVTYVAVGCLRRDWALLMALSARSARGTLGFAAERIFEIAWKSALVLLVWSVLDYLFERQHLSSELRMSRQEMKDEYKETEGNPVIKGRIRRLQRQMRRRRQLDDTKRAAVVITNPTEYAIALEYRPDMPAPVVVAKGRNLFAAQIKEIARWENIPMVENRPLAHVLYRTVEVGQSVPANLYAVIAEILAAVYRAETRALAAAAAAASAGAGAGERGRR